jgi:cytidylate kinase
MSRFVITLPLTMDHSQAVFVLTGVMASGKSTVAQLLAERFPKAAHVCGDVFRRMIVAGRRDMTPDADSETEDQLALRYPLAAATTDTYL